MKRNRLLNSFLIVAFMFCSIGVNATKVYSISENFSSAPTTNWDFGTVTGQTFTYDVTNKLLQFRWSASSFTTKNFTNAITKGTDNLITVESIVKFYTSGNSSSGGTLYFLDSNGNAIFGIAFLRSSSQWRVARATDYPGLAAQTALPAKTDILAADAPIAKITAVLDMNAKTLSYTAILGTFDYSTRIFTAGSTTISSTAQAFINSAANDIKTLQSNYFKASSLTGTNGYDLMYMGISTEQVVSTADVTINFKDQDNNLFKTSETAPAQVVGSTYAATAIQKASLSTGGNYYVLIPDSSSSIVVGSGGSTLNLRFRRSTLCTSMVWNGTVGTNTNLWSEWYQNLLNGTAATSYQKDASVTFDASATNKSVLINDNLNLGAGNIIISSDGYKLSGSGAISGTGSLSINLSGSSVDTLGVTNNMTGGTTISGGSIIVTKAGTLGSSIVINGPTTLTSNYAIPATTFNAATQIQSTAATSIAGVTTPSATKVSISSNFVTLNAAYAFGLSTTGTLANGSELELNGTGTDTKFGLTAASSGFLANVKVTLKGTASLFIDAAQSPATTINIGTLSGEAGSRLGWGKTATVANDITWSVGALNENSTYAGTITNTGGYLGSGSFYLGNFTHFTKVGTGILTFSGTANTHNGNFVVKGGELNLTGTIGNATSKDTVALGATLSGTGTIGGATILNGTLKGRLNFGSSLILAGTTNLTVDGFATTQYDSISVVGAVTNGGTLNVTVNAAAPAFNTSVKLIKAGSYVGSFSTINVPTNYTFDSTTGILTYTLGTKLSNNSENKFNVYPTMTRGLLHIDGENITTIDVISLAGQYVKQVQNTSNKTTISLSGIANGAYLVKAHFADGSVKVQNILLQK